MRRLAAGLGCLLVLCLIAIAKPAAAQVNAANHPIEQLVVGDGYFIEVARHGVQKRYEGTLVKANDRWLVLGAVSEGRNDSGVIIKKAAIGRATTFTWIPREAATLRGRVRANAPSTIAPPVEEEPPLAADCSAEYASEGNVAEQQAKFQRTEAGQLAFEQQQIQMTVSGVPYLCDLPLLGAIFRKEHTERLRVKRQIDPNEVLCIRTDRPEEVARTR